MTQNFLDEFNMIQTKTMFPVSHIVAISLQKTVKNKTVSLGSKSCSKYGSTREGEFDQCYVFLIGKNSKKMTMKVSICLNSAVGWGLERVVIFLSTALPLRGKLSSEVPFWTCCVIWSPSLQPVTAQSS